MSEMKWVSQEELFGLKGLPETPFSVAFPAMADQQRRVRAEAARAEILPGGNVAILVNPQEMGTIYGPWDCALPSKGVKIVIYVEDPHGTPPNPKVKGHNLGVARCSNVNAPRADHPKLRAIVEAAGETKEWFADPTGSYFARGAERPMDTPSKVNPRTLAEAAARLFTED
jgi:hypothetical protein